MAAIGLTRCSTRKYSHAEAPHSGHRGCRFYPMAFLTAAAGVVWYLTQRDRVRALETLPQSAWRLGN